MRTNSNQVLGDNRDPCLRVCVCKVRKSSSAFTVFVQCELYAICPWNTPMRCRINEQFLIESILNSTSHHYITAAQASSFDADITNAFILTQCQRCHTLECNEWWCHFFNFSSKLYEREKKEEREVRTKKEEKPSRCSKKDELWKCCRYHFNLFHQQKHQFSFYWCLQPYKMRRG